MDNLPHMQLPFPTDLVRKVKATSKTTLEPYLLYNNRAEAILDLLRGPDVEVYVGDQDWCLPMSQYEAAMYLLRPEHIPYLTEKLLDIEISSDNFFMLLFLLCAESGEYSFRPIYNPGRFNDEPFELIYTQLTDNGVPEYDYAFTPELVQTILQAFDKNRHMYYFLIYSRRVFNPLYVFNMLNEYKDQTNEEMDYYLMHAMKFNYPELSINNNIPSMLVIEYYQNYGLGNPGAFGKSSQDLCEEIGLFRPQHKTRRQLVKMYKYAKEDLGSIATVPFFSGLVEGKRSIIYEYTVDRDQKELDYEFDSKSGWFPYYVASLSTKLMSENNSDGDLNKLSNVYNGYRYSVDYLHSLSSELNNMDMYRHFLNGLAAYHLLYQCITGRTSKYVDLQQQNLSQKPYLYRLRQLIDQCTRKCPILSTLPFYNEPTLLQRVYSLDYILSELESHYTETDEIDTTIGLICMVLDVSDITYARIINHIIEDFDLRKEYGIIKTTFKRFTFNGFVLDSDVIEKVYKKMNFIDDFQGRNPLVLEGMTRNSYDEINAELELHYTEEEDIEQGLQELTMNEVEERFLDTLGEYNIDEMEMPPDYYDDDN